MFLMGLLGNNNDDSGEEVKISATIDESEDSDEADLMNEVESKFGTKSSSDNNSVGGRDSGKVDLEDLHRQNEKIISLLEELTRNEENEKEEDDDLVGGDMNGIL